MAAVKAHEEKVRKLTEQARAELLRQMKEILSEDEWKDFKAALDRPARGATVILGPDDTRRLALKQARFPGLEVILQPSRTARTVSVPPRPEQV